MEQLQLQLQQQLHCFTSTTTTIHVSLTQLVRTIHNICKVRGLNPDQRKKNYHNHSINKMICM